MRKTGPTNIHLRKLISDISKVSKKNKSPLWARVAEELSRPSRQRRAVNLSRISRNTKKDEVALIPGKVLGTGDLAHKLTVVAYQFSDSAAEKIAKAGKAMTIEEYLKKNPKGSKARLIG